MWRGIEELDNYTNNKNYKELGKSTKCFYVSKSAGGEINPNGRR